MNFKKACLPVFFLFLILCVTPSAPPVEAQDNIDWENRISGIENLLHILIENLSPRLSAIENIIAQSDEYDQDGQGMMLFAVSLDGEFEFKPLSFSLQVLQSGEWEPLTLSPGSSALVWVLDSETSKAVPDATLELTMPMFSGLGSGSDDMIWWLLMGGDGQSGFGGIGGFSFSLSIQNGVGILPAYEGMGGLWSGTVNAPGYASQSFFYRVGEPTTVGVVASVTLTPDPLVRTHAATISAWGEDANLVGDARIYIDTVPYNNPASITTPDKPIIQLSVKVGDETVYGPTTLHAVEPPSPTPTPPRGGETPWGAIGAALAFIALVMIVIIFRGPLKKKIKGKAVSHPE